MELQLPKLDVAGSNPVSRSIFFSCLFRSLLKEAYSPPGIFSYPKGHVGNDRCVLLPAIYWDAIAERL